MLPLDVQMACLRILLVSTTLRQRTACDGVMSSLTVGFTGVQQGSVSDFGSCFSEAANVGVGLSLKSVDRLDAARF